VITQIDRRKFLSAGAAGMTLAFAVGIDSVALLPARAQAAAPLQPNLWLTIAADGTITIVSPAAELGQGTTTTLPAVLADELDADWADVRIVMPNWHDERYGNPFSGDDQRSRPRAHDFNTTASFATRGYFTPMRIAGAQARRVLLDAAAQKWAVPMAELATEPSVVVHSASDRRLSYGEIAAFAKAPAELPKIEASDLKSPSAFRFIGNDVPRLDVPAKTIGAAKYAIDVKVPGMVYAAVLHSPYEGGHPEAIDDRLARGIDGITEVVRLPGGVAVVGTSVEATQAAKNKLKVTWSAAPTATYDSERALVDYAASVRDPSRTGVTYFSIGDARAAIKAAATVFRSEVYRTHYVYHAQLEPLNAIASVNADGQLAEIWCGTQSPSLLLTDVAAALAIERTNITLHHYFLGGGYGRRGGPQDVPVEAALIAKAVGKPVKLIWSREDDIGTGRFRPMTAQYIEAGFDRDGKLVAWHHRIAAESVRVYREMLTGGRSLSTESIVMRGSILPQYPIANHLSEQVMQPPGARLSSLRGVGTGANSFVVESVMDEIARLQGKDPVAFRLELTTGQPRVQNLIHTVAAMSDWTRKREGTALGIAVVEKEDTLEAAVAEVSVDRGSGKIKVHNFWAAIDAGLAVQPKNLAMQTEAGIIYGLGHVLRERITIKDGRVQQTNFSDYLVPRMSDIPHMEVRVISTDNPPTGVGENGVPVVGGAVGNAVAALTGTRLRELPFAPERVRDALGA
jgi:isoquinoline 1-oxidoreductase beta subunit